MVLIGLEPYGIHVRIIDPSSLSPTGAFLIAPAVVAAVSLLAAHYSAPKLSDELFYVCNLDGSISPHLRRHAHRVPFWEDDAPVRHRVMMRAVRTILSLKNRADPDLRLSITSQLCSPRLRARMRDLGFEVVPTRRWKVAIYRSAFLVQWTIETILLGRSIHMKDQSNWNTTLRIRIGDLP